MHKRLIPTHPLPDQVQLLQIPTKTLKINYNHYFPPPPRLEGKITRVLANFLPVSSSISRICQWPSSRGTPRNICHAPPQTLIRPWIARRASSKSKVRRNMPPTLPFIHPPSSIISQPLCLLPTLYYALARPILTSFILIRLIDSEASWTSHD